MNAATKTDNLGAAVLTAGAVSAALLATSASFPASTMAWAAEQSPLAAHVARAWSWAAVLESAVAAFALGVYWRHHGCRGVRAHTQRHGEWRQGEPLSAAVREVLRGDRKLA
jgi:hypothetical protein